jgi:hypothetical protein
VEQPWYVDNTGVASKFDDIHYHFCKLQEIGPDYGYYPKSIKIILIVPERNLARAKIALAVLKFKITTGSHYCGGFIGEKTEFESWMEDKTHSWAEASSQGASNSCQELPPGCLFRTAEVSAAGMAVPA